MNADESITELAAAVAELGALPMPVPVGPEPQGREAAKARVRAKVEASRAMPARERIYHLLCATYTHGEAEAMLAEVDGRHELDRLTARVAELEAERHSTNEALDDAVQALRANAKPSPSFAERADRETDPGRRAAYRMLAEPEPEFHAYLHHPYQREHDMPETGGQPVRIAREDDDPARCLKVHPFSPRDGWRMVCGNCDHSEDADCHQDGA